MFGKKIFFNSAETRPYEIKNEILFNYKTITFIRNSIIHGHEISETTFYKNGEEKKEMSELKGEYLNKDKFIKIIEKAEEIINLWEEYLLLLQNKLKSIKKERIKDFKFGKLNLYVLNSDNLK